VAGVTGFQSLVVDPSSHEIWLGGGTTSTSQTTVFSIAGGTAASHVADGPNPVVRKFSLPSVGTFKAMSLAYDPVGEGGTPELVVGAYASDSTPNMFAYKLPSAPTTPTVSTNYKLLDNSVLPLLGLPRSTVVDGNVIYVVSTAPGGSLPYQQAVLALTRLDQSSAALISSLNGPYQSSVNTTRSDAPQGLSATSAVADQLWVANTGFPGGAPDTSSTTNPYAMTAALRSGSPLGFAIDNATYLVNQRSRGVAVNEAASEVYVSDALSSVMAFNSLTGAPLAGATGTITNSLDVPQGLFWDKNTQKLYIANTGSSGQGYVDVWVRSGTGVFTHSAQYADAGGSHFQNPAAVFVTTPASGNQQLWIAGTAGNPGAVRMDLGTLAYSTSFKETNLIPGAIAADSNYAYVGQTAGSNAAYWGVGVITGASSSANGYLQIAGATKNIAGLAWCNQQ
jgi:hypothetical protein